MPSNDITVIIPTCDRPDSLDRTLSCLSADARGALTVSVVVVDNGNDPRTREIAAAARGDLSVRYLHEPRRGKEFALNRGCGEDDLGEIVVFLDDDMSPENGWWRGVKSIVERHPDCDFFTGRSHIIWPREDVPGWARSPAVQSWAHSVLDYGPRDRPFQPGEWPSGNMFWVRRRVFEQGFRFDESLNPRYSIGSDAEFHLQLAEAGLKGVAGPDAVAGHRVQEILLDVPHVRSRALRMGRALARIRLDKPNTLHQARMLRDHPVTFRAVTAANLLRWMASYASGYAVRNRDARIARQLIALLGIANNWEALRTRRP